MPELGSAASLLRKRRGAAVTASGSRGWLQKKRIETTRAAFTECLFSIPQGTDMSRPEGPANQTLPWGHSRASPSSAPIFGKPSAPPCSRPSPSLHLSPSHNMRLIKPFWRLNLLHPSGSHLIQGLALFKPKCMVKGGSTELEKGPEGKRKRNPLQFFYNTA